MNVSRLFRFFGALLFLTLGAFAKPLVVIDAGHGGYDRGGMPGQSVPEKGYTLDVAKRLESTLRSAGFQTVLTRRSDTFVSLGERTAIGNARRNAIFVSIHFNGASNADAYGIETYYSGGRASASLAASIHRSVLRATGSIDRRVRSRGFFVLRRSSNPAVLCELGFLTNRSEARRIDTGSYRQKLAEAIARGIDARY
jgi:N-acetylmuramoyl-L-alanine amidase